MRNSAMVLVAAAAVALLLGVGAGYAMMAPSLGSPSGNGRASGMVGGMMGQTSRMMGGHDGMMGGPVGGMWRGGMMDPCHESVVNNTA